MKRYRIKERIFVSKAGNQSLFYPQYLKGWIWKWWECFYKNGSLKYFRSLNEAVEYLRNLEHDLREKEFYRATEAEPKYHVVSRESLSK